MKYIKVIVFVFTFSFIYSQDKEDVIIYFDSIKENHVSYRTGKFLRFKFPKSQNYRTIKEWLYHDLDGFNKKEIPYSEIKNEALSKLDLNKKLKTHFWNLCREKYKDATELRLLQCYNSSSFSHNLNNLYNTFIYDKNSSILYEVKWIRRNH